MTRVIENSSHENIQSEFTHPILPDEIDSDSDNEGVEVRIVRPRNTTTNTTTGTNEQDEGEEERGGGTGWFGASILIVNAALGAGLLNFPQAFDQAGGVLVATIVQFVLMIFIVPALIILAYCSDYNNAKTLQHVLFATWGKTGHQLTSICVAIYCFGTCITFLIIIGDQFDRVFASLYGTTFCHTWYMNRTTLILATSICFILPLCYSKKIDFLKHVSSVGVVAVIYVVFLIIAQYYKGMYISGPVKTKPDEWTDVFLVVPVICFGYQCHVSVIPIYACMKPRNLNTFIKAMTLAILICIFTYTIAATYGYLTFGSKIASDILKSYDPEDPSVLVAIIAIAIKTYTTYPILLFCGREAVSNVWLDMSSRSSLTDDLNFERLRRIIIATVWFCLTIVMAVFLPNMGVVIKLLGSLAAVFIFVFPGMCLLRICLKEDDIQNQLSLNGTRNRNRHLTWLIPCSVIFISAGAFLFGCVLTQAVIYDFIEKKEVDIPLCTILVFVLQVFILYLYCVITYHVVIRLTLLVFLTSTIAIFVKLDD